MAKQNITENKTCSTSLIEDIKIGKKDPNGYSIVDVLAKGNEYAIYEIDAIDINNKLRLVIDGINDETEKIIVNYYIEIKDQYITAKGLLYRSTNFGLMKNRVAHTLATALSGNVDLARSQFTKLIDDINNEYKETYLRRVFYVFPGYILIVLSIIMWFNPFYDIRSIDRNIIEWVKIIDAGIIGGAFSMTFHIKNLRFDVEIGKYIYNVWLRADNSCNPRRNNLCYRHKI